MKTSYRAALCMVVVLCVAAPNDAQEKPRSQITILVPEKGENETVVKVSSSEKFDGCLSPEKETDWYYRQLSGEGDMRKFQITLAKGKSQKFRIRALIEPNNYTKIVRVKEITLKGGAYDKVTIDMTREQPFPEFNHSDEITVRYVPTPDDIVDEMSKLAKIGKNDVVYDLGCGDARMLIRPIQKFGAKRGVGVEYDPKVMKEEAIPNVRKHKLQDKIELRQGDMLKLTPKDLEDATVVMIYIGDDLGKRVGPVLKNALKPGSRIVSHRFSLGDWRPNRMITIKGADGDEYDLLLWIVPERKIEKSDK